MSKPLVSIIIPTYGGPDFLTRALDSIVAQSMSDWEVWVVDDNGLDNKSQIMTELAIQPYLEDKRFHYIAHDVNMNGSVARNTGFANSSGKYIALLDDDDEYFPWFLSSQVDALEKQSTECGMIYCSYDQYLNGKKDGSVYAGKNGHLLFEILIHSFEIPTSSWLVKRSVYEELNGFDESFQRHQDWEFVARLASKYSIIANSEICYKRYIGYRNSPKSSCQFMDYRKHYLEKMKNVIELLPPIKQRQVIVSNKLDAIIPLLKEKKIFCFLKEYVSIKPGLFGIRLLFRRLLKISKLL